MIFIYIYIYRERETYSYFHRHIYTYHRLGIYIYIYTHIYICTYIYILAQVMGSALSRGLMSSSYIGSGRILQADYCAPLSRQISWVHTSAPGDSSGSAQSPTRNDRRSRAKGKQSGLLSQAYMRIEQLEYEIKLLKSPNPDPEVVALDEWLFSGMNDGVSDLGGSRSLSHHIALVRRLRMSYLCMCTLLKCRQRPSCKTCNLLSWNLKYTT